VTIALLIEPEDQTVDPGREAVFTIHVVNQSGVVDRVSLDVLGTAGAWARVEPAAVALMPGTDATATVVITPPAGTSLGPVPIGIRATAETSGFVEVAEANLNVGASRMVEAELRPRTATGKRRATSVVVLHNVGNAPTKVQVVATDPDDAIVFDAPTAVQIGPGMTTELPLRMRLPSREKQGATRPYSVLVEGGDSGQSLDGQVRQPAKKRWPILVAMLLAGLLVVAYLALKQPDSKAITEGRADEATTTTIAGATTTVAEAGATTTVAGGAATTAGAGAPGAPPPGAPGPGGPGPTAPAVATTATTAGTAVIPLTFVQRCPGAKGTADKTAQRVICSWEGGRLGAEVNQTITPAVATSLGALPHLSGQIAGSPVLDPGGSRVPVSGCGTNTGRGVQYVIVATTGASAGLVTDFRAC